MLEICLPGYPLVYSGVWDIPARSCTSVIFSSFCCFRALFPLPYWFYLGLRTVLDGNITVLMRINDRKRPSTRLDPPISPRDGRKEDYSLPGRNNTFLSGMLRFRRPRAVFQS